MSHLLEVQKIASSKRKAMSREEEYMNTVLIQMILAAMACLLAPFAAAQNTKAQSTTQQAVPPWVQRGVPGAGHAALAPLVGSWRVELSIYGTMGRSPDLPPIVSSPSSCAIVKASQPASASRVVNLARRSCSKSQQFTILKIDAIFNFYKPKPPLSKFVDNFGYTKIAFG